ncbi:MAG: Ig-like domain-containing protein [Xenococcus sp. (in: cyanobacteria)]
MLDHINYKKITTVGALGILIAGFFPTEAGISSSTLSEFPFYRASSNLTEFHTTTYSVDGENLTGVDAFQQFSNTERSALDLDAVEARELDLTKLDLTYDYNVKVYFINEGAGYRNQLRLNSTGSTIVNGLVFKDVSCRSGTGCGLGSNISASQALNLGDYITVGNLSGGTSLDFEVIRDGYNNPNNHVWHVDKNLNQDNLQHVIAYEFEGYLILAWEDLYGGGDRDYNDIVFAVDIGEYNLDKIPTVDNDPPSAGDDEAATDEENPTSFNVLNDDSDPDGDSLSIIEVNSSSIGVNQPITLDSGALLTLNDDGTFTYDPNGKFEDLDNSQTETETFTYTIDDANGNQDQATVTITVNGISEISPLLANLDNAQTYMNQNVTVDVLSNDTDENGASLDPNNITITVDHSNALGTATVSNDQVIYTPSDGYLGNDSFTYTITDTNGETASATVNVAVMNRTPIANNDEIQPWYNIPMTFNVVTESDTSPFKAVIGSDTDPEGDTLTIVSVTNPSHGNISFDGQEVTYTPNSGYLGPDSFTYTISDDNGDTDEATVSITVINAPD